MLWDDKLHEECGVFAILKHKDASYITMLGLHALQHRGQDAVGIVSYDEGSSYEKKALGLVLSSFERPESLRYLPGNSAIGHTRYSTSGDTELANIQPFHIDVNGRRDLSLAHNGQLLDSNNELAEGQSDSHLLTRLMVKNMSNSIDLTDAFKKTIASIKGGFAIVAINENILLAARDPVGIRPLVMGMLDNSPVFCSETCALDVIGAKFIREVENGEIIRCSILPQGSIEITTIKSAEINPARLCLFEYIYFARNDSYINNKSLYNIRKKIGAALADETYINADLVTPIQNSGTCAALGYAQHSNTPFELAITANAYSGRSFISPNEALRDWSSKLKHSVNKKLVAGKHVVVVDDSLVRGTTLRHIIKDLKAAEAASIHIRIASPILRFVDYFGINIANSMELLSNTYSSPAAIADYLGVNSIKFLSLDGLYHAICGKKRDNKNPQFSDHHFTGDYPDFYNSALF